MIFCKKNSKSYGFLFTCSAEDFGTIIQIFQRALQGIWILWQLKKPGSQKYMSFITTSLIQIKV